MEFVEIYNECKQTYDKLYNGLRDALFFYEDKLREEGILFHADKFCDMFEIMYQYALLQVISSCGTLSVEEGHIIRDICIKRDLIEYIKEFNPNCCDWDKLENMSQDNLLKFVEETKVLINALNDDFVMNSSKALYAYNNKTFNINTMSMLLTSFIINLLNVDNDKKKRYYDDNILLDCFGKIRNEVNNLKRNNR